MGDDRVLGFAIPWRSARGRVVRLGPILNQILTAHAYPEPVARLVAETLALTALLGSLFRPDDGQMTVQAKGEGGPIRLLVADWRQGELRGYASQDLDRRYPLVEEGRSPGLEAMLGSGYLAITLDQTASADRYQGIVALGGDTMEASAQGYFEDSEQLPTLVRLAARRNGDGVWTAGGLVAQHLPRAEEGAARLHLESGLDDWAHVEALAATVTPDELTEPSLPLETLLWRLFNEDEVRILPEVALARGCRCSLEHIRKVLGQFPEEERVDMRNADGVIAVDCEFCSRQFLMEL
jgi:molecular chaperone Hsp33